MAIISMTELNKRRAEAEARPAPIAPESKTAAAVLRSGPSGDPQPKRRTRAKNSRPKCEPTGDYDVGYCKPPVASRFDGTPGPGRPKGSRSHDGILRKKLEQKRKVRKDGKESTATVRELILDTMLAKALGERDKQSLFRLVDEIKRLYPEMPMEAEHQPLTERDALTLAEYEQEIRDRLAAEKDGDADGDEFEDEEGRL